jgi:hypothetical protein
MTMATKKKVMYGLLLVTILLSIWVKKNEDKSPDDAIETANNLVKDKHVSNHTPNVSSHLPLKSSALDIKAWREKNAIFSASDVDLFSVNNWKSERLHAIEISQQKAQAEAPIEVEAPKPPPLPFTYFGQIQEDEHSNYILLMQGQKLLTTAVGKVISQHWRVDSEDEQMIQLTYLPLNDVVTLPKN